jgi:hypothetical protein
VIAPADWTAANAQTHRRSGSTGLDA